MGDLEGLEVNVHVKRAGTKSYISIKPPRFGKKMKTDLGEKLKMACEGAPIHSPKSRALASETLQATIRVLMSV